MKPMLASPVEFSRLEGNYPFYMQPKLDGIRCLIKDGVGYSRSLKLIPNRSIQAWIKANADFMEGFDGELMPRDWTEEEAFRNIHSGVMSYGGEPDFTYAHFDQWDRTTPFSDMYKTFKDIEFETTIPRVVIVPTVLVNSEEEIETKFDQFLKLGYEGAILRHPNSPYKFGRSTAKQMYLLKIKGFLDTEGEIVGYEEMMHNANPATENELGYTTHSSHKENKIPMAMLGAFVLKGAPWQKTFKVGTGLSEKERREFWTMKDSLLGKIVKYRYLPTGGFIRPRNTSFLGFRDPIDMGE